MIKTKLCRIKYKLYLKRINNQKLKEYIKCRYIKNTEERDDSSLAILAHTLEKGLGAKNKKKNFGEEKAQRLCEMLEDYISNNYSQENFGFKESFTVLEEYFKYKRKNGERLSKLEERFEYLKTKTTFNQCNYKAGLFVENIEDLQCYNSKEIERFLSKCNSIRNYADKQVSREDIEEAIRIANYAPSACNRQPNNIYYSFDVEKIKTLDNILPGNSTVKDETPNYLILTTKITNFDLKEYNQWYINGGIYAAYLRIALNMVNIANCIYQWVSNIDEEVIKKLYKIPESEVIICVFGIGYYDEKSYCIRAQRKGLNE